MSESRDLTVSAYFPMTDQEFTEVFSPKTRSTPTGFLMAQVHRLNDSLAAEAEGAVEREDYEAAQALRPLHREVAELLEQAGALVVDDTTDARYQLEDRARALSKRMDEALSGKKIQEASRAYEEAKAHCFEVVAAQGNDQERRAAEGVVAQEAAFLSSNNPAKIRERTSELESITYTILRRTPEFQQRVFASLSRDTTRMNDPEQAKTLVAAGRYAIDTEDWDRLGEVNHRLFTLLPQQAQDEQQSQIGFS